MIFLEILHLKLLLPLAVLLGKGVPFLTSQGPPSPTSLNMEKNFYGDFCFDDINNDGNPDIVITNNSRLSYYLGEGGKDFSSEEQIISNIQSGYSYGRCVLNDIDDDGDIDIIINIHTEEVEKEPIASADYDGDFFVVYENLGNSSFVERRIFAPIMGKATVINRFDIGDMDNDGRKDLVCVTLKHYEGLTSGVYIYKQLEGLNGEISFSDPIMALEDGEPIIGINVIGFSGK